MAHDYLFAIGLSLCVSIAAAGDEAGVTKVDQTLQAPPGEQVDFFESRVRPILAEQCFRCHGVRKQESGLRLDSRQALLKGNDAGPVVVPSQPEESPLIVAIRYNSQVKMPPKEKLSAQSVADLTAWVQMGAPWPENSAARTQSMASGHTTLDDAVRKHWAFQPVLDRAVPTVNNRVWPRTSIDRFILSHLESKGLSPSPQTSRRVLIRRATFDLIGLPPTSEEIEAFEADRAPDAYIRLIERLLASPHYGERWGRYWLDVARYADTKGYILFQDADFHWAYTYRDYVISAFNRDLAYDQFLVEQIAADRIPEKQGKRPLAALGFLTLGGRFMGNFHDVIDDRIDVVCRGLMSLTVTCARCHDHKFDPIPARDYYSLYGIFASTREPMIPPEAGESPQTPAYTKFLHELESRRKSLEAFVTAKERELLESTKRRLAEYLLAAQQAINEPSTEDFMLIADSTDLNPAMLIRWQNYLARTRNTRDPVFVPWHALAELPAQKFAQGAATALARLADGFRRTPTENGQDQKRPAVNSVILQALLSEPPNSLAEVARTYAKLLGKADQLWRDVERRAALDGRKPGPLPYVSWEALRQVLYGADSPLDISRESFGELALFPDRPSQAKLQELRNALQKWLTTGPGAPARVMSLDDAPVPTEPRVFLRGNPNNLGEHVPRQFLTVLAGGRPKPFRDGSGRLELARAIGSRHNPLTARALVNRMWMHHFGTPLVATPGDFGLRSDPPVLLDLLDHLAARFVEQGWSSKALHRLIMLSSTYQQQSDDRPRARAIDPENIYYWRMNRRRLDFEALRDALLAVSGKLNGAIGGPPSPGAADNSADRRTVYCYIDRLNLPGLYRTFDFADPNATSPRRDQTTVAPQALFLMNHSFVLDTPGAILARPEIAAASDIDSKVDRLECLIYGRRAGVEDCALARAFLGKTPDRSARWPAFVQALLLTNEFVFVD
jgi:cytochrome c553